MANPGFLHHLRIWILFTSFVLTSACSSNTGNNIYEGDDFTFSAPARHKTELYETPIYNKITNSESLLFSNIGHYPYFNITRQQIPAGGDLDAVFTSYVSIISEWYHSESISQNTIIMNDRTAIEYVHREFMGEPYVQTREIWMEYNGWAYSLVCTSPADATPGAINPVSEQCIRLAEGFQFK